MTLSSVQQDRPILMYDISPSVDGIVASDLENQNPENDHPFNGQDPHNPHHNTNGQADPVLPSQLPSSYTTQENGNGAEVVYIVIGIVASLGVIAAIGIFCACRKRKKENKKETMANAYLEFSQSQASTGFGRNKSQNPTKTNEESYYY
ncbi:hypothetical protein BDA99DRAFT_566228 [Phascolomyces articulosus]|uniref:Uncharacterized protein n=1 Tax=Phascolomyces articulosus TaxID=60185 RepID=A0AAD5JVX3_9FUNG|nr:hypothetical protein BDA99DRAFT_566228 [Phascolomyces articulosus]